MLKSSDDFIQQLICVGVAMFGLTILIVVMIPVIGKRMFGHSSDDDAEELCPNCKYDTHGLIHCPECGAITRRAHRESLANLRDEWPTEDFILRVPQPDEPQIVILTSDDQSATNLLAQHLEARGIPAFVAIAPDLPGVEHKFQKTGYRLTVRSDDEVRARAIVDHLWPEAVRSRE